VIDTSAVANSCQEGTSDATAAPARPVAPRTPRRFGRYLWLPVLVGCLVALPWTVEKIQYAVTRGRLRAQADVATEELSRLTSTSELVSLSDTSRIFRLVAQRVQPSVVHIETEQGIDSLESEEEIADDHEPHGFDDLVQGRGSGIVVDESGYIVTNYHVIRGADRIRVRLGDGRVHEDVEVVGFDRPTDLAVLRVAAGGLIGAAWGDSSALEVGDWVLAVGNPYGLDRSVTCGIVSGKQRRRVSPHYSAYQDFLQSDVAVNPGNSGGPLVNVRGEVVGINTAIVGRAFQGISFAVPSETARRVFERLVSEGVVARGWLGVELDDLSVEEAQLHGLDRPSGAIVRQAIRGGPARAAGVKESDVILEWNHTPVTTSADLVVAVGDADVGVHVPLVVWREGARQTLDVVVGRRPDTVLPNPD
jgi:serine protease Do